MIHILLIVGFICSAQAKVPASDFEDFFSSLNNNNNNNKNPTTLKHLAKKNTKLSNVHDSIEMSFPLFYDFFPMAGLEEKMKDSLKLMQEEKDLAQDNIVQQMSSKMFKQKKDPKNKVLISFTEFFIPLGSHKTTFDSSMPKKLDLFEDFFKDFSFKEFEEPFLKHRLSGKMMSNKNLTKIPDHNNESTALIHLSKKEDTTDRTDLLFRKPKETDLFLFRSGMNNHHTEKQVETVINNRCCEHPECKMGEHCQRGMCSDKHSKEDFISKNGKDVFKAIETANLDRLTKIAVLYTIPVLIGIGGIIIGIEILRKHKHIIKGKQISKDYYDPLQRC